MSLRTDLISWWELDEASGTRVDSHGSNDLTDGNTVGQAVGGGPDGGDCADFESSNNEYLINTTATDLSFGDSSWSIIAWVRHESLAADQDYVAKREPGGGNSNYELGYANGADRIKWIVWDSGGGTNVENSTVGSPSVDTWYMVFAYFDADANEIGLSVNDGTVETAAFTGVPLSNVDRIEVGNGLFEASASFRNPLDGRKAYTAMYGRVITSSEVTELYNSGSGLSYADTAGATYTPKTIML